MGLKLEYNDFEEKYTTIASTFNNNYKKIDFEKKFDGPVHQPAIWLSLICLCVHHLM